MKLRIKKIKVNFKRFIPFLVLTVLTAGVITSLLISLPSIDKYLATSFDLSLKDSTYWKQEYLLDLEIQDKDILEKDRKIEETRNILFSRLNKYRVEEISIENIPVEEKTKGKLKITVQSSKDLEMVERLLGNRFYVRILTPKDSLDFYSEENQYDALFDTNYNKTEFTLHRFRNVYITQLPTSTEEESYFAVFKINVQNTNAWEQFLTDNAAQIVGVGIDSFVTPVQVEIPQQQGTATGGTISQAPTFAIQIQGGKKDAEIMDILYNSGVIPLAYTISQTTELEPHTLSISYIQASLVFIFVLGAVSIYLYLKDNKAPIIKFLIVSTITFSIWISVLKTYDIPVDSFIAILSTTTSILIIKTLVVRPKLDRYVNGIVLFISVLSFILGFAYMKEFALNILSLLVITNLINYLYEIYLVNLKRFK